ncbi:exonuclease/endonuclease/phosphatase family protein [Micromonospora auratinigra]|uniref:Endonuclease/Exonuclease/phosphatase family n=1 Tax=Micromonospora auratinigra TaxID=261654 RepID=A0A1A8Z8Z2_9ACTN|nr:hypothetical protein [Micromonospora auratinigra]SBT40428.1 Endonuclease/Exonuclease/phosphatase family [Micromonospora auratinigra]
MAHSKTRRSSSISTIIAIASFLTGRRTRPARPAGGAHPCRPERAGSRAGQRRTHINAHANSSIEDNGAPVDIPRTACAEQQFQEIKDLAIRKKDEGQVIVSGDLNIDFSEDRAYGYAKFPWQVFEANSLPNLRSCYNLYGEKGTGTHGSRHIDYVYFWKRLEDFRYLWMTDYQLVTGTRSDHNGVVATFAIEL